MIGFRAGLFRQAYDGVVEVYINMLGHDTAIITDLENKNLMIMSSTTDHPSIERINLIYLNRIQKLFKCSISCSISHHTIRAKTFLDVIA